MNTKLAPDTFLAFTVHKSTDIKIALGRFLEIYGRSPKFLLCRHPSDFSTDIPLTLCTIVPLHVIWLGDSQPATYLSTDNVPCLNATIEQHQIPSKDDMAAPQGRPRSRVTCPFCLHRADPEDFGVWGGWVEGKEPTYWNQLRMYIFRRDGFRCHGCHEVFPPTELVAHHIIPKEQKGSDSARNLLTYCLKCHPSTPEND